MHRPPVLLIGTSELALRSYESIRPLRLLPTLSPPRVRLTVVAVVARIIQDAYSCSKMIPLGEMPSIVSSKDPKTVARYHR